MFKRYLIPICLIMTIVPISPSQVEAARYEARAILAREVGAIAKRTVVRIESSDGGFGSGVIIGRAERGNKNIYTVLTAAHVIRTPGNTYQIVTPVPLNNLGSKRRIKIDLDPKTQFRRIANIDLAIVSFESIHT
jgi:hypothetical protein